MPNSVTINVGEKAPIYGKISVATGTITITGTPTCSLYNQSYGTVISPFPANITGMDAPTTSSARVWYVLDATGFVPGLYRMYFVITALGSDGITRVLEPTVDINVSFP